MESQQLPLGFGMALAQDAAAMEKFASLPEPEKQSLIRKTHQVKSRSEMRRLAASLTDGASAGM